MKLRLSIPRVRLLPLTLAAIAIVLPLKLAAVWQGLAVPGFAPAAAEAAGKEAAGPPPGSSASTASPSAPPAEIKPANDGKSALLPGDKVPLTQTEIDLLQKLQARRDALDTRERQLDMREGLVKAAEQSLEAKTKELVQLQANIEALTGKQAEAEEKQLQSLVTIYEKMKPKDAARILNDMEMDLLASVVGGMKDSKIAPILAEMDPAKARSVTARLAERRVPAKPAS